MAQGMPIAVTLSDHACGRALGSMKYVVIGVAIPAIEPLPFETDNRNLHMDILQGMGMYHWVVYGKTLCQHCLRYDIRGTGV